jgi:hypothetical protein
MGLFGPDVSDRDRNARELGRLDFAVGDRFGGDEFAVGEKMNFYALSLGRDDPGFRHCDSGVVIELFLLPALSLRLGYDLDNQTRRCPAKPIADNHLAVPEKG